MLRAGANGRFGEAAAQRRSGQRKSAKGRAATDRPGFSELHRFSDGESIFELDTEVAHSAIHLRLAEQEVHSAEVASLAIYLRHLGSPHGLSAIGAWLETDRSHPVPHEAGVLPCRDMSAFVKAPGPEVFGPDHQRNLKPSRDGFPRPLGDFEAHRPPGFALDDRGAALDLSGRIDVGDLQLHQVASAQLAVDGEIEERQLASPLCDLEADRDRP